MRVGVTLTFRFPQRFAQPVRLTLGIIFGKETSFTIMTTVYDVQWNTI